VCCRRRRRRRRRPSLRKTKGNWKDVKKPAELYFNHSLTCS